MRADLLFATALIVPSSAVAAETADEDYKASMECIIAFDESEAMFKAMAGKPSDNATTFAALRERYMTVLVFEGKKAGLDRTAIAADFEAKSKASTTISDAKSAEQLDAAYKRQFAKAVECAKRI